MRALIVIIVLSAAVAVAQNCVVPAPPSPPVPHRIYVDLPIDGGSQGCRVSAVVPGSRAEVGSYLINNAKCAQAVAMAKQAAANDNGWNDGGTP